MEIPYVIKNTLEVPELQEELGAQGSLRELEEEKEGDEDDVGADERFNDENSGSSSLRSRYYVINCLLGASFQIIISRVRVSTTCLM